jgi:hypothetical protein
MTYTAAAALVVVAALVAGTDAYSVSRSSLRQLSQPKSVQAASTQPKVGASMKMEGA